MTWQKFKIVVKMMRCVYLLCLCLLALLLPTVLSTHEKDEKYTENSICGGKNGLEETLSDVVVNCGTEVEHGRFFTRGKPYAERPPEIKYPSAKPVKYWSELSL